MALAHAYIRMCYSSPPGMITQPGGIAFLQLCLQIDVAAGGVVAHHVYEHVSCTSVIAEMIKTLPNVDLFITNFWQGDRPVGVDDKVTEQEAAYVKGYDGNIVVRIVDGGNKYYIVTTLDSDGKMTVKTVSGPYISR